MEKQAMSFQEKVAQLRSSYLTERLSKNLAAAKRLCGELTDSPDAGRILGEIHRIFHSIRGTAASFGLRDISAEAIAGEQVARQLQGMHSASFETEIGPGLAELDSRIDHIELLRNVALGTCKTGTDTAVQETPPVLPVSLTGKESPPRRKVFIFDVIAGLSAQLGAELLCFGYSVASFSDPEALRMAMRASFPDVMVMDIEFSVGPEAGKSILGTLHDDFKMPPVIFISSRRDFDTRLKAIQAGGEAYFTKPVKASDLVDSIDALTASHDHAPFRVLIVDDEPEVAKYHSLILEQAGMLTRLLHMPTLILETLTEFRPDIILMDMYMPECSGRDLSRLIRQVPEFVSLPIVFLSTETDKLKQASALRVGAEGFLTKPIQQEDLVSTVVIRAERTRILRSLMVRDALTGLFNHTEISQFLVNALATAEREKSILCFVMIDVDFFKKVNDTYGHPAGDQVLVALARILRQRLRESDIVGRYGGEEFAAVLKAASINQATAVIDQLREDFSRIYFYSGQHRFSCTFSGGVAGFPEFRTHEALLEASDQALYKAKELGRNQIVVASATSADWEHTITGKDNS